MKTLLCVMCSLFFACNWSQYRQHLPSQTVMVDGVSRTYHVFVPTNPPETPMALLVGAHGGGGAGTIFPQQRDFEALAEAEGIIIALPQGRQLPGNEGEWLLNTTANRMNDIHFITALIDDIAVNHSMDPKRVYGMGYSLGSMFSYELACQMSDRFAAIASYAGTMPVNPTNCNPERFAPIMHIHSTDDSIISYTDQWDWKAWPAVGPMRNIPSLLSYWQDKYTCTEENQMTSSSSEHVVYSNCAQGTQFEHHRLRGEGHNWPAQINGVPTHQVLWNFLSRHQLP